jgi:hypothetical protein
MELFGPEAESHKGLYMVVVQKKNFLKYTQ